MIFATDATRSDGGKRVLIAAPGSKVVFFAGRVIHDASLGIMLMKADLV